MKKWPFLLLLFFAYTAKAQTQSQLNDEACKTYKEVDQQLNVLYQHVLKQHAANPSFLEAFKASQVAWLKFRDAQLEALFPTKPGEAKSITYGSLYPMSSCQALAQLTRVRNQQLQTWVEDKAEGDVSNKPIHYKK